MNSLEINEGCNNIKIYVYKKKTYWNVTLKYMTYWYLEIYVFIYFFFTLYSIYTIIQLFRFIF